MSSKKFSEFTLFALAVCSMPACFFAVIWGWATIDLLRGRREVSTFIRQHQQIVDDRRADPAVHEFSLKHEPMHSGTLLIQFDVADKDTYELLESDLDSIYEMTFPPRWETNIRSNEELGNNFGYAAWGIGIAMEGMMRIGIAVISSILSFGVVVWLSLRQRGRHTTRHGRRAESPSM